MKKTMNDEATKLYGECACLMDKIFDKCETMLDGWDDLINHLAEIDDTQFETERDFYYYYYKYLRNVYWRILKWDEPQPFNSVHKKEVDVNENGKIVHVSGYSIWNYDYKMFLWAVNRGLTFGMNAAMIDVAEQDLTPAELKRFEKKAQKDK